MQLTQNFKYTVRERAIRDKEFHAALIKESQAEPNPVIAKSLLPDASVK